MGDEHMGISIIDSSYLESLKMPSVLYKYREFENPYHRKILIDNCVYFASPITFPDKKDCHPEEILP